MNLLGLVFGLLLIFACTFSLSMHKYLLSNPIETSCKNHLLATRKILNSYELQYYEALRFVTEKKNKRAPSQTSNTTPTKVTINHQNRECSQLNLWPLLLDGRDKHPALYETAAQLLRVFYQTSLFGEEIRTEYALLDTILNAASKAKDSPNITLLPLEKLDLQKKDVKQLYFLKSVYYRMLKGTKEFEHTGYPALLDYFCFESKQSQICLKHASIEMFTALFGPRAAIVLYDEVHESKIPLSKERIMDVCAQNGKIGMSEDVIDLLDLHSKRHRFSGKRTLVETEGDVCLKKNVFLPSA